VEWSPIKTVLGITNSVWKILEIEGLKARENHPVDPMNPHAPPANCCYWTFGEATTESLKQNLCCGCFFVGYFFCRVLVLFISMPVYVLLNFLLAWVAIFPTMWHFWSIIVCASMSIGPFAKFFFAVLMPLLLIFSPITILLWSCGVGCSIPFDYCMADSFKLMFLAPVALLFQGVELRKQAFKQYAPENYEKGTDWHYEIYPWVPVIALIGILFGLVFCLLAFTLLSLFLAPKMAGQMLYNIWTKDFEIKTDNGSHQTATNNARRGQNDDVCVLLCQCCYNSCLQLGQLCEVVLRLVWSVGILFTCLLFIPASILYSLWIGVSTGATAWHSPKNIWEGPKNGVIEYYEGSDGFSKNFEFCNAAEENNANVSP